jgi:hypothetical protein
MPLRIGSFKTLLARLREEIGRPGSPCVGCCSQHPIEGRAHAPRSEPRPERVACREDRCAERDRPFRYEGTDARISQREPDGGGAGTRELWKKTTFHEPL